MKYRLKTYSDSEFLQVKYYHKNSNKKKKRYWLSIASNENFPRFKMLIKIFENFE